MLHHARSPCMLLIKPHVRYPTAPAWMLGRLVLLAGGLHVGRLLDVALAIRGARTGSRHEVGPARTPK